MKDKIVKNKMLENKDRAKSFALGLLCVVIIGAYVASTVNIFAAEEGQGVRPEGMPETDWNNYKLRLAQEAGQEGAGEEGAGENARPEGRPAGMSDAEWDKIKPKQAGVENPGPQYWQKETELDTALEKEKARQEGVKKAKQAGAKTKAELGGEKIAAPSSVINPNYSAIYAGKPVGTTPLLARSAEKAVEPFMGEVSPEQRAYFERHKADIADAQLLELVSQNKVLFDQQDEIETAQHLLGVQMATARQTRKDNTELNEFLDDLLLMTDRRAASTEIGDRLRIKIDELTPRLNEQTALLDMFKNMIEENRRVIAGEERPLSLYERGADVYAKTKRTLTAPQRLAAEQYGQLKSGASSIQNKLRSWWITKAEQERRNPSEERSLSTRVELEPGVVARLRRDATQEETKKHESLVSQLNFAKQMERYNTGKLPFLTHENKIMAEKAQEKIAILKRSLTGEPENLLGNLQKMYKELAAGAKTKQALETRLSEQAKEIVGSNSSY